MDGDEEDEDNREVHDMIVLRACLDGIRSGCSAFKPHTQVWGGPLTIPSEVCSGNLAFFEPNVRTNIIPIWDMTSGREQTFGGARGCRPDTWNKDRGVVSQINIFRLG